MPSITETTNGAGERRWRARWRDPDGRSRERWFARKGDARDWLTEIEHDKLTGAYVDPAAGRVLFRTYAAEWLEAQTFDESTRDGVERRLRLHIVPTFGGYQLAAIRASHVQAWLRGRQQGRAAESVRLMLVTLSAILSAAVDDRRIAVNPCSASSVKAPVAPTRRIVPWPQERVRRVINAHPLEYRAIPLLAAMAGLRQGECFGLRAEDVVFLRRVIEVRQQVKIIDRQPVIAPPKYGKPRTVPMPDALGLVLAGMVKQGAAGLLFTRRGEPIRRHWYNETVWQPALRAAGVERARANGMHALRHFYASVLLEQGVSIRALSEYLGHHDPGFTLRTYTHLMPATEDRARDAIDAAFQPHENPTGQGATSRAGA